METRPGAGLCACPSWHRLGSTTLGTTAWCQWSGSGGAGGKGPTRRDGALVRCSVQRPTRTPRIGWPDAMFLNPVRRSLLALAQLYPYRRDRLLSAACPRRLHLTGAPRDCQGVITMCAAVEQARIMRDGEGGRGRRRELDGVRFCGSSIFPTLFRGPRRQGWRSLS